mgnify:CR=1 FL=1
MRLLLSACLLALLSSGSLPAWDGSATELARIARDAGLDSDECYRVRDLNIVKDDLKIYLTDGFLILGRPAGDRHFSAVFTADVEGGDAEVLLLAPTRGERLSLASATGSPNLNEHFKLAVFIFTDDTYESLVGQLQSLGSPRKSPERGALLAGEWNPVMRNLVGSFEIRLVQDLMRRRRGNDGFFYAGLSGKQLGNFDVVHDPRAQEQIRVGRVASRDQGAYFEVWTSFPSRAYRSRKREPHPSNFQLGDFRLEATLEPDLTLKGVTRMSVRAVEAGYRTIDFDVSRRVRIKEAFIDGQPAEVFQRESIREHLIRGRDDDVFLVVSPQELVPGRSYEVEIRHEGTVISDAGNRVYFVGPRDNWYPNRLSQFAEYDVTFRYPSGLDLVAAGEVVERRSEGDWNVTRRKTGAPVRFLGFNLGNYETKHAGKGGYTVEVCANRAVEPSLQAKGNRMVVVPRAPGWQQQEQRQAVLTVPVEGASPNPAARLETLASEIASAFEFMAGHFGPPPIRHLTVSPIPGTFGQGFPGLLYLSTIAYLDPRERPPALRKQFEQLFFSEILHAHETAHQWWGNVVTSASYRDDWVMEALANYTSLLYLEKRKGRAALQSVLEMYKQNLLRPVGEGRVVDSMGPIVWGLRLESSAEPAAWQVITYEKGSWIIHMLRRRMGDEQFFRMLGELRRRYEFQPVTTEQFRALATEFLPYDDPDPALEGFFEHWVYSTGIPALEFKYTTAGRVPKVELTGTLVQTGTQEEISIDVPVEIHAGGKRMTRWLRTGSEPAVFTMELKQKPQRVALDPSGSVLAVRR